MEAQQLLNRIQEAVSVAPEKQNVGKNERIISSAVGLLLGFVATQRIRKGGFPLLVPAGYLIYRGISGYCHVNNFIGRNTAAGARPFQLTKSVTILRNRTEVFNYWRNLENLPNIMKHVESVQKINDTQYHWEVNFNNQKFSWNAMITEDIPNERISWQSLESADIHNSGSVEFMDAPGNQGTELRVTINYIPAETELGKVIAGFLNPVFKQMVKKDLRSFKRKMETGEIPFNKPFVHA